MPFVTAAKFDINKVTITAPKKIKRKSGQTAIVCAMLYKYDNGETLPLYIKTPMGLKSPFGLSSYDAGNGAEPKYSLPLSNMSLKEEHKGEVDKFFNDMRQLDQKLLEYGVEYSDMIFNKDYSSEQIGIVEAMYTTCVNQDKEGRYPPRITPKFGKDYNTGLPNVELFSSSDVVEDQLTWDKMAECLPAKSYITLIYQPMVWMISGRFGLKFQAISLYVVKKAVKSRPMGFHFHETHQHLQKISSDTSKSSSASTSTTAGSVEAAVAESTGSASSVVSDEATEEEIVDSDEEEEVAA